MIESIGMEYHQPQRISKADARQKCFGRRKGSLREVSITTNNQGIFLVYLGIRHSRFDCDDWVDRLICRLEIN